MKKLFIIFGLATLAACKPNIKPDVPSTNGLDLSNYVAVGNSLTAGYADGTLYREGQLNSYPNILAQQFSIFGPITFRQPLLPGESGWPINMSSPDPSQWRTPKRVLGYSTDCFGVTSLAPVLYAGVLDTLGSSMNISSEGPFNNFGIPGIRAADYLTAGYAIGAASFGFPYALRMFTNPFSRPLDQLKLNNPSFFTLWLGSNDVLGYALSGGEGSIIPTHPNNISTQADFQKGYDSVLQALTSAGAKGVLLNIPDITTIPFFTTIPANGLVLDTMQAVGLNAMHAGSNMSFAPGANFFVVQDLAEPGGKRQMVEGEMLLLSLPQDSLKCGGWGSAKPIPKNFLLSKAEIDNITVATNQFNAYISLRSTAMSLPLVDMNSFMKTALTGIKYNGVDYNTQFLSGGIFSVDGVHLNPRGYALVANEIIKVMNAFYKSSIPLVDVHKYSGIRFPL